MTRILSGRKDTKRWIDGSGMKRSHEEKANGGGTVGEIKGLDRLQLME